VDKITLFNQEVPLFKRNQIYFEDVSEGAEIGPLVKGPITDMDNTKFCSMHCDFYPGHYDNKWAVEKDRIQGAIVYGFLVITYMSQLLTDWIMPDGFLRKFSTQVRAQTFINDVITYHGKVTRKYENNGLHLLDCELTGIKQDNTMVVEGKATIELPARPS
jgi:acyl dehydratase